MVEIHYCLDDFFPHFAEAFRTFTVTQLSGSLIKGFFSYLSKVLNTASCNHLEETVELKLILEINKAISGLDFDYIY